MRFGHALVMVLVVAAAAAAGEEEDSNQAADRVIAALEAGDGEALRQLAARDEPDPWIVAEELCFRG